MPRRKDLSNELREAIFYAGHQSEGTEINWNPSFCSHKLKNIQFSTGSQRKFATWLIFSTIRKQTWENKTKQELVTLQASFSVLDFKAPVRIMNMEEHGSVAYVCVFKDLQPRVLEAL